MSAYLVSASESSHRLDECFLIRTLVDELDDARLQLSLVSVRLMSASKNSRLLDELLERALDECLSELASS